ncbi:ATP-grasp domain-containing protein [Oceanobacillus sp. HCA-5259]|uniref:ATP-grasp domain-containing protein n=1 Tax=Oceanobacillus sp. HCA-5259 TaxID=3134661 RepID=UPI0030C56D52
MDENRTWLNHLEEAVPLKGYGNRLSMYLISLEAWRRGITINFFNKDNPDNKNLIRYSLNYGGKEYQFESSRGNKLSKEAFEICNNKDLTKQFMTKLGVKVPQGKRFFKDVKEEDVVSFAETIGYPVVLKPSDQNAGKGVFSNISGAKELKEALWHLTEELNYKDFIVEEFIPGTEYRVFLINGKVLAAVNRIPANIVGNGRDTVETLINQKNKARKDNPALSSKTIKIDREIINNLKSCGYDMQSIPSKGEKILLRNNSNVSTGGDSIDVTDSLTDTQIDMAQKAAKSIPGLDVCGLDMLVDIETGAPTIIEINTKPMIGLHVFPMEGKSRDVVKHIVDYYFPESIDGEKSNLYFDFENVIGALNNITTKELQLLPPNNLKEYFGKKISIIGKNLNATFMGKVRRISMQNSVYGYIKKLETNSVEIVLAHYDLDIVKRVMDHIYSLNNVEIETVEEEDWRKPVKVGFEIKRDGLQELYKSLAIERSTNKSLIRDKNNLNRLQKKQKEDLNKQKEKNKRIQQELDSLLERQKKLEKRNKILQKELTDERLIREQFERRYENILESKSWIVTKPFRNLRRLFK